jgi:hypothetical protein
LRERERYSQCGGYDKEVFKMLLLLLYSTLLTPLYSEDTDKTLKSTYIIVHKSVGKAAICHYTPIEDAFSNLEVSFNNFFLPSSNDNHSIYPNPTVMENALRYR